MKTPRSVNTFASPLDALRWHIEMGADELIDHVPVDRYATAVKSTSPAPETIAASVRPTEMVTTMRQASGPALAPAEGARDAIDIAAGAVTVEDLFTRLKAFDGCALKFTATNTVSGHAAQQQFIDFVQTLWAGEPVIKIPTACVENTPPNSCDFKASP